MEAAYTCTRLHGVTSHEANLQFNRRSRAKNRPMMMMMMMMVVTTVFNDNVPTVTKDTMNNKK